MSYSHIFFSFQVYLHNVLLKKSFNIQETCIRKKMNVCSPSALFNLPCNPDDLNLRVLSLLFPTLQVIRPINNAIQKFTFEYHIECDNHYNYNNHLFKSFPFCDSLLVIKFSAYDQFQNLNYVFKTFCFSVLKATCLIYKIFCLITKM